MPDFPISLANANDKFRQVLHTGKTSQVSVISLQPREVASFGGPEDEHLVIAGGTLRTGDLTLGRGHVLTIRGGEVRELAADEDGVKLVRIGGIEAPEGSSAPDRQTASAQVLERQWAREFNVEQRKKAAKEGAAMKDGSFPIYNAHDLVNAADLLHHADDVPAARAHIKKRAAELKLPLPYSLRDNDNDGM